MFNFFRKKQKKEVVESIDEFNKLWNTDIDDIWKITDKNNFIIAMSGFVGNKCNYGEALEKLSSEERIFYIVNTLEGDVNNGGFSQYFFNSRGLFINELENAFTAIEANITANICKKAITSFGNNIPQNPKERVDFFEDEYSNSTSEVLGKCDDEFYKYEDNLEELLYLFVVKNKSSFT